MIFLVFFVVGGKIGVIGEFGIVGVIGEFGEISFII
jgi:hypothetical protein